MDFSPGRIRSKLWCYIRLGYFHQVVLPIMMVQCKARRSFVLCRGRCFVHRQLHRGSKYSLHSTATTSACDWFANLLTISPFHFIFLSPKYPQQRQSILSTVQPQLFSTATDYLQRDFSFRWFQVPPTHSYLIFVISFTQANFWENEFYTEKRVNYKNGFRDKIA